LKYSSDDDLDHEDATMEKNDETDAPVKRKVGRPPKDKALVAAKKAQLEAIKREAKLERRREFTKLLD